MVVVAAVAVLLAAPAQAQRQGQGRGQFGFGGPGGGGPMQLLQNPGVQKELKLSEEQIEKVNKIGQEMRAKMKEAFAGFQDLSQEERREKMQEFQKTMAAENKKALGEIGLNEEQSKRLKQIELQTRGYMVYADPEVQKTLGFTDEQKEKLKTIGGEVAKEMQQAREDAGGDFRAMQEKMTAIRKEATTKVQAVLTDEQKAKWKEMTGAPFQLQQQRRRPGGNPPI
jgi:hypothetical protein